jgi:hypothetical protein
MYKNSTAVMSVRTSWISIHMRGRNPTVSVLAAPSPGTASGRSRDRLFKTSVQRDEMSVECEQYCAPSRVCVCVCVFVCVCVCVCVSACVSVIRQTVQGSNITVTTQAISV